MTDDNNELIMTAMGILTHAGDARLHAKKALKHVQALQFEEADTCLQEAKKEITAKSICPIPAEAEGERYRCTGIPGEQVEN